MARYSVDIEANIKGFDKLDNIEKQIKSIQQSSKNSIDLKFDVDADGLKGINKQFDSLGKSAGKSFETAIQKQINTMAKTQRNAFSEPLKNITKVQKSYDDFWNKELSKPKNKNYGKNSQLLAFEEFNKQMLTQAKKAEEIRKRVSQGFTDVDTSAIKKSLNKYVGLDSNTLREAEASYSKLISLQKELKTGISDDSFKKTLSDKDVISRAEQYIQVLEKCKNQIKVLSNESGSISKPFNQLDTVVAGNKTLTWLNNNTKAAKEYGEVLEDLARKQKSATDGDELANYNKQVKSIISEAQAKGLAGKSAIDEIGRSLKQIGEFTSIYGLLQNVIYEVPQQMVQAVKDIDNSMVNLQMATGVSNSEAKELMNTYMQMGKELKATATDVATSATEWLKQGKTIKEANNLAKDSIVLSKIGDLSSEDSTKTITAAMKSYDLQESEIMNFIDKISAIDMASATDVGGLANAFNKVAANARQAGVESEKVLAYAATIGETTQAGMDSVGTSLNAIFSRMGNIKLSRLKDPESGEDLSNVETSLRNVGIELRESTGEFRDFDNVLDETANRWDSFSEVTQRSIASSFAGTHHLNDFMVLMQNYSQAEKYIETANNSSGESLKKYEAYQNSIQGKTEKLKATFQELSTTIVNSDLFKGLIDGGTELISVLTKIIDVGGGIPALFASIGGFAFFKNLDKPEITR